MRRSSEAAEAIICSFRSMSPIGVKTLAGDRLAETWVQAATAARCDPHMRQEPLSNNGLAGEWLLVVAKGGLSHPLYPGQLADELLDEVFLVLGRLGRIIHDDTLKPWHGNVWPDDSSARALAFRVRLAREALALDRSHFYGGLRYQSESWRGPRGRPCVLRRPRARDAESDSVPVTVSPKSG